MRTTKVKKLRSDNASKRASLKKAGTRMTAMNSAWQERYSALAQECRVLRRLVGIAKELVMSRENSVFYNYYMDCLKKAGAETKWGRK